MIKKKGDRWYRVDEESRHRWMRDVHETAIIDEQVELGADPFVGFYSIIRGEVVAGKNLRLGALSSIEGTVKIGDFVTIRGKCEIPNSVIGNRVSIYSGVKFYDTPHPPDGLNQPPIIEDDVIICCDSAILGGVKVGRGSLIGARVFVTDDIPPESLVTLSWDPPGGWPPPSQPGYKVRPRR